MALSQIAFDFGDPVPPKKEQPARPPKPAAAKPAVLQVEEKKPKSTRGRKSLKEAAAGAALVQVPDDEELFKKMYYSIGEVADMFGLKPSLIRLWENEFDVLKPKKNGKGDRLFRPEDVKMLQQIFHLLREKKYTMQGAKEFIKSNRYAADRFAMAEELRKIKAFLYELKAGL